MKLFSTIFAGVTALILAASAFAGDTNPSIMIKDPYIRSASKSAPTGAAFMEIMNRGDQDDRLVGARSDIAAKVELHTHIEGENGVMQMRQIEGGINIPAGGIHRLARGGDHVMFMGLKQPFQQGETVPVTLTFEKAGDVVVEIPVDLTRKPMAGMKHDNADSDG